MKKITHKRTIFLMACLLLLITEHAIGWQQPCPGCCTWDGYGCVRDLTKCPQCETCIRDEQKQTCTCDCRRECGCGGKTCPGCCKCENCACTEDDTQCSGCKSCSWPDCTCHDDHSKCDPGQWCCDGQCCDTECCGDECCEPDNCESCVGDQCVVCGGDPDQKCCDGVCTPKCEDDVYPTICYGTSYDCGNSCDSIGVCDPIRTTTVYENIDIKTCQGGCPGECPEPSTVLCWTVYDCVRLWWPPWPENLCNASTGSCNNPTDKALCYLCQQSGEGDPQWVSYTECK